MKVALIGVLLGFIALSLADDNAHYKCGPLQKVKVNRQWAHAFGDGKQRIEFVVDVYKRFFKEYPKARELFKDHRGDNIYSHEFQAFALRVFEGFTMVIDSADDHEVEKVAATVIKKIHADRGVKAEYFPVFRDIILEVLDDHLGIHLDWDAWMGCTNEIIAALS